VAVIVECSGRTGFTASCQATPDAGQLMPSAGGPSAADLERPWWCKAMYDHAYQTCCQSMLRVRLGGPLSSNVTTAPGISCIWHC